MNTTTSSRQRRFFLPHIGTDATFTPGLAMLKALLLGYHIPITDDELLQAKEAVDNSDSATSLQQLAQQFGLQLEQTLLPADHLYLPDALPALVLLRPISEEPPHWAVVWERLGPFYQVIDPRLGRLWLREKQLLSEVSAEAITLTLAEWRTLAATASARNFLQMRLVALQLEPDEVEVLLHAAYAPDNDFGPAMLDAALRTVEHVVHNGGFRRGPEAAKAVAQQFARSVSSLLDHRQLLAPVNWTVLPDLTALHNGDSQVQLHGIAALRITGVVAETQHERATGAETGDEAEEAEEAEEANDENEQIAAETASETATSGEQTPQNALAYLREEGWHIAPVIGIAMILAGAGIFFQAILFRGLAELSLNLMTIERRMWAIVLLLLFTVTMIGLKWFSHGTVQRLGHRLDGRLRLAVLAQLPQLSNGYFQQISAGDMIERIHNLRAVRKLPFYMSEFLHIFFQFLMTIVGLLLLDWLGAVITFLKLMVPFFFIYYGGYFGSETERTRTYLGFLSRFYLDAMEGLVAIRTHGAEGATRREYEGLLGKWVQSNINVYQGEWRYNVISTALSYGMTGLVILVYALRDKDPVNLLLVAYWSVNLESLRGPLIFLAISYLFDQGKAARFLQLLNAPREEDLVDGEGSRRTRLANEAADTTATTEMTTAEMTTGDAADTTAVMSAVTEQTTTELIETESVESEPGEKKFTRARVTGLAITLEQVSVIAAEQQIFREVDLTIAAGSQIGIVGPSGAGKSTLVGLLLGWHYPAAGRILIDGAAFDYARLQQLRAETAWVDTTVQLWNRSFLYNLRYGGHRMPLNMVIDQSDLRSVLERLPDGMQTKLGGEGRLVSGGEGQRMRFGRSLQRPDARLVILDEPFRGLDREKRRTLLSRARAYWPDATMLCITHDVGQTQDFERVLVVEDGRIIEDDAPQTLLARPGSRYRALLDAEDAVRETLWASENWRRLWLEDGMVKES